MQYTDNYNIPKPDYNNIADIKVIGECFDKIDKGLVLNVGESTGSNNNYVIDIGGIVLTEENKGASFKFWADRDSTGSVTINNAYNLIKANGNPVKNLKKNAPYVITYDGGTNFFLSSGGADESDSTTVGTDGSKVLAGETFIGSDGEIHTGQIPIRNAVNTTLKAGQSVSLESGYYKDKSTIKAESLATAMSNAGSTLADPSQLVNGIKAVDKNGKLITGTATVKSLGGLNYKFIPKATLDHYTYSNTQWVKISDITDYCDGNAPIFIFSSSSLGSGYCPSWDNGDLTGSACNWAMNDSAANDPTQKYSFNIDYFMLIDSTGKLGDSRATASKSNYFSFLVFY